MKITKGLDIPISGQPEQTIHHISRPLKVAVLGRDYHDLRPAMQVQEGDYVKVGQCLFTDRKNPDVQYTAPGSGKVTAINRGARRVLNSVVIELEDDEQFIDFGAHQPEDLLDLDAELIRNKLLTSGQWTMFRARPYGKPPAADDKPSSIFVNVMETRPLAADPLVVLKAPNQTEGFLSGLQVLSRLAPTVHVCHKTGDEVPACELGNVQYHDFEGVHPAGLSGTHIHYIDPVSDSKTVWYLSYQDVTAIGLLFTTGKIYVDRIISLAGPPVRHPRLLHSRLGACTDEMVKNEIDDVQVRVISGSVLSGHRAAGSSAYIGRYNLQVSVIQEGEPRSFMHWLNPLLPKFSVMNVFLPGKHRPKEFAMTSTQNGSERAMVPIGNYERVMPLDILPTQLLRALLTRDTVLAQELGALELDEEDLSLCTFVCHGKYEYGIALRECLRMIEKGE